jgi:large subunit ribosomal protein L13
MLKFTYSAKPSEIEQKWFVVDATDLILGRLATNVAKIIRGKHKSTFTAHMNCGDKVIIINAEKVAVTGNKLEQNKFYWHTNHPGGIKERTWKNLLNGRFPERLIENAVKRMLPKESPLARDQFSHNLYVYAGSNHPHEAQQPQPLDLKPLNNKIAKRA